MITIAGLPHLVNALSESEICLSEPCPPKAIVSGFGGTIQYSALAVPMLGDLIVFGVLPGLVPIAPVAVVIHDFVLIAPAAVVMRFDSRPDCSFPFISATAITQDSFLLLVRLLEPEG